MWAQRSLPIWLTWPAALPLTIHNPGSLGAVRTRAPLTAPAGNVSSSAAGRGLGSLKEPTHPDSSLQRERERPAERERDQPREREISGERERPAGKRRRERDQPRERDQRRERPAERETSGERETSREIEISWKR